MHSMYSATEKNDRTFAFKLIILNKSLKFESKLPLYHQDLFILAQTRVVSRNAPRQIISRAPPCLRGGSTCMQPSFGGTCDFFAGAPKLARSPSKSCVMNGASFRGKSRDEVRMSRIWWFSSEKRYGIIWNALAEVCFYQAVDPSFMVWPSS